MFNFSYSNAAHQMAKVELSEVYRNYPYISVEILTSYKGGIRKAVSKNDTLRQEQKDIMNMADLGTDISVKVQYIPDNTLKHNDPKEINGIKVKQEFVLTVGNMESCVIPLLNIRQD